MYFTNVSTVRDYLEITELLLINYLNFLIKQNDAPGYKIYFSDTYKKQITTKKTVIFLQIFSSLVSIENFEYSA